MVAAYRWVLYVRLLTPLATHDFKSDGESLDDAWAELAVRNQAQAKEIRKKQLRRTAKRLAEGREQQATVRRALLLEDDPDELT